MCIGEGWIVYLEGREKYQYDIGDAEYWEYVRTNVKKLFLKNIMIILQILNGLKKKQRVIVTI